VRLGLELLGASGTARATAGDRLPGTANYIAGGDRSRWHTGIPTYADVRYNGVWPGVDVVYYGDQSRLEYDFRLAAGADASRILLRFAGAKTRIAANGDLLIERSGTRVRELAPVAYQQDRSGARHPVRVRYLITRTGSIGLRLGAYDHTRPLVIDPGIVWSTYLWHDNPGPPLAVDTSGNVYITDRQEACCWPTTTGAYQTTPGTSFIAKLSADGSHLVYSTTLGNEGYSASPLGIAVDALGDAYVMGGVSGNLPTTAGAYQQACSNGDVFVLKLSPDGSKLLYGTCLPLNASNATVALAVDPAGNAYVAGDAFEAVVPTTPGAYQTTFPDRGVKGEGVIAGYVLKLNPSGSALVYATYLGGSVSDENNAITVNSSGQAYVTGNTASSDFPTTPGAYQTPLPSGTSHIFATKLTADGSGLVYSTVFGAGRSTAIALDQSGSAYVLGAAAPSIATTSGAYDLYGNPAFVTKLLPDGSGLAYATRIPNIDSVLAVDASGAAIVAGSVDNKEGSWLAFATPNAIQTTPIGPSGHSTGYFIRLSPNGSGLCYASYLGGSTPPSYENPNDLGSTNIYGLAVDASGNAYLHGGTAYSDFPTTSGAFEPTWDPNGDTVGASFEGFATKVGFPSCRDVSFAVACSPQQVPLGGSTTCTATLADADTGTKSTPTGTIYFKPDPGPYNIGTYSPSQCTLAQTSVGTAACSVGYTPRWEAYNGSLVAVTHDIPAKYGADDSVHAGAATYGSIGFSKASTTASISCSPTTVAVGTPTRCTWGVADNVDPRETLPTAALTTDSSGTFQEGPIPPRTSWECRVSTCVTSYTPMSVGSGYHTLTASFPGNLFFDESSAHTTVAVAAASPPSGGGTSGGPSAPPTLSSSLPSSSPLSGGSSLATGTGITGATATVIAGGGGSATATPQGSVTVPGLNVSCGAGPCHVQATATAALAGASKATTARHRKPHKPLKLGSASFTLASGQTSQVTISLTSAARSALARLGALRAMVTVTDADAHGNHQSRTVTVTIKVPKRSKRHKH
jgi:hypothetical protein